jgi:hypothetical protein
MDVLYEYICVIILQSFFQHHCDICGLVCHNRPVTVVVSDATIKNYCEPVSRIGAQVGTLLVWQQPKP